MTTEQISQWLREPAAPVDPAALKSLLQAYPYFLPGRYMDAARLVRENGFQPQSWQGTSTYLGNWLLFHELMTHAMAMPSIPEQQAQPEEATEEIMEQTVPTMANTNNEPSTAPAMNEQEPIIQPVYTEDYFLHQGIIIDDQLPQELDHMPKDTATPDDPKSLMVVMSFSEWLMHFRTKTQKEKEEEDDRKALKTMWQREKLAAALEEEEEEIPENVFEMAVNSIAREDGLASESLAEILTKQGKTEQAIEMYKKLSLRNPQKSAYFAQQIAQIEKNSGL